MARVPHHITARNKMIKLRQLDNAEKVGRLYITGLNQREIAEKLGISRQLVTNMVKLISGIWRERLADTIESHRAEQLAKIDRIEAEAWAGWERSKRDAFELRKQVEDGDNPKTVKSRLKRYRDGEVRFLELASKQVELRSKLLGLDKPESIGASSVPLLEVIVSTRAEAAKILPYMDFASEIDGQVVNQEVIANAPSD